MYRVIVVDDEPEFRVWLRSIFEGSDDFQVVGEASSGCEALRLLKFMLSDLVIADVYMPDMDGLKVARHVQKHFPGVKTILVSIQEGRIYDRLAKEEGALAFIPKARLSLDALRQTLQKEG